MGELLDVDPRMLHLPSSRVTGADPAKLARQTARFGKSVRGMPVIWVTRGRGGALIINDGVTRATRIAKLLPGHTVRVEVLDEKPRWDLSPYPTLGDNLP
jgi:hypothetical protein